MFIRKWWTRFCETSIKSMQCDTCESLNAWTWLFEKSIKIMQYTTCLYGKWWTWLCETSIKTMQWITRLSLEVMDVRVWRIYPAHAMNCMCIRRWWTWFCETYMFIGKRWTWFCETSNKRMHWITWLSRKRWIWFCEQYTSMQCVTCVSDCDGRGVVKHLPRS